MVYRDPIHDFGFFRYDPKKLRFTEPAVIALEPKDLRVGTEIRINSVHLESILDSKVGSSVDVKLVCLA